MLPLAKIQLGTARCPHPEESLDISRAALERSNGTPLCLCCTRKLGAHFDIHVTGRMDITIELDLAFWTAKYFTTTQSLVTESADSTRFGSKFMRPRIRTGLLDKTLSKLKMFKRMNGLFRYSTHFATPTNHSRATRQLRFGLLPPTVEVMFRSFQGPFLPWLLKHIGTFCFLRDLMTHDHSQTRSLVCWKII